MVTCVHLPCRKPVMLGGSNGAAAIEGRISFARSDKHRVLDISAEYWPLSPDGGVGDIVSVLYSLKVGS